MPMKLRFLIFAALTGALAMPVHALDADSWEERCRKTQLDDFDKLTKITCPDNERRGVSLAGVCATLLLPFKPTAKMPDWETYRMMWAEVHTHRNLREHEIKEKQPSEPGRLTRLRRLADWHPPIRNRSTTATRSTRVNHRPISLNLA